MYGKMFFRFLVVVLLACAVFSAVPQARAQSGKPDFKKCLRCHTDVEKEMARKGVHKPFKQFECSNCQNPHAAKHKGLLREDVGRLCRSCHQDEKGLMAKKFGHKPFEEGKCLSCHKPHASNNANLLVARNEELCFGCHAKEGFSQKHKHSPVQKGNCLSCHAPHGSDYDGLVKKERKKLCVTCHSVQTEKAKKAHLNYPVQDTDCLSCHSPHGSKRGGLVKENLHKPFAQNKCSTCHNGLGSGDPLGLKIKGASVCLGCHPAVAEEFNKINSHVGGGVFCVNCHNAHASDQEHFKKGKESKMCLTCHEDTKAYLGDKEHEHQHPLTKEGKCTSCHRPHGSNFRYFFAAAEFTVCTSCHERHATFTHPLGEDAIDPRSKRDITCITCHNLMGSPSEFALRFDMKKQLCVQCHKGY